MSRRFFTADFHLGMDAILELEHRPFSTIAEMNERLVKSCESEADADDIIIHVGDLACFNMDGHLAGNESAGLGFRPDELLRNVKAEFVNIRGNHDINNRVKSICESMTIKLGRKYPNVVVGHYPSYDPRASVYARKGWICICGHVHGKWKHCLDLDRQILNVNVGVDAWNYGIITEDELIRYIGKLLSHRPDMLYRCKTINGKLSFIGDQKT